MLHPPKVWERFVDDVYSILKRAHLQIFSITLKIFTKILSLLWRRKVIENLALFDTLLKRNNGKISVLEYKKPMHTDQCLQLTTK